MLKTHEQDYQSTPEDVGGVFGRAVTMAGIDRHGLTAHHVTRHTAATLALGSGVSILGAMAQGGCDPLAETLGAPRALSPCHRVAPDSTPQRDRAGCRGEWCVRCSSPEPRSGPADRETGPGTLRWSSGIQ